MFKGKDLQKIINTIHFLLVIIGVILDPVCVCCKIKQKETVHVTRNHTSQFTRRDDHKNERIYVKLPIRSMIRHYFKKVYVCLSSSAEGLEAGAAPRMCSLGAGISLLRSQDSLEKQLVLGPGLYVSRVRLGALGPRNQGSPRD